MVVITLNQGYENSIPWCGPHRYRLQAPNYTKERKEGFIGLRHVSGHGRRNR